MLMIPLIVQNLNAIGQSDDGLIDPSVISMLLAGLQAIGDRHFKTQYPTGWVAGFGRLCPYSPTLKGSVGESRKRPLPKPLPYEGRGFDSPPDLVGKGVGGLGLPLSNRVL